MRQLITGPELARRLGRTCSIAGEGEPHVEYVYRDEDGAKSPLYNATYIVVSVYFSRMSRDLHLALFELLQLQPGVMSVTAVLDDGQVRPLVRARFDREQTPLLGSLS